MKALWWMAAGAAALAAVVGRRRRSETDALEDLEDRPVARAVLQESVAAARRVEELSSAVQALEARIASMERASPAGRLDAVLNRVALLEERLEAIAGQRAEIPAFDALIAQAEVRLASRIDALDARASGHDAAIQYLREHASQTEAGLQAVMGAVQKLAAQISRGLPSRIEPRKETTTEAPLELYRAASG